MDEFLQDQDQEGIQDQLLFKGTDHHPFDFLEREPVYEQAQQDAEQDGCHHGDFEDQDDCDD